MALQFRPYPIPEEENQDPLAPLAGAATKIAQMMTAYDLQKEQMSQQKEETRQQRILDYMKLRGEYGEQADQWMRTAGISFPGMMQGPLQGPTAMPPTPAAPAPAGVPSAAPGISSPLDITPDFLANLRKTQGTKGAERFVKEQDFLTGQKKAALDMEQNQPLTPAEVSAAFSPYGELGKQASDALIAASPDGRVSKTLFQGSLTALSQSTQAKARKEASNLVKPPPGYRYNAEGNLEAIKGGPADQKITDKLTKESSRRRAAIDQAKQLSQTIDEAAAKVNEWTAGLGSKLANVPGTPAADLDALLTTIKANLGFEQLQEMRNNSPTGGALGQVSDRELKLLTAARSSLEQKQSPEQLRANLAKIAKHYAAWRQTLEQAEAQSTGGAPSLDVASASGADQQQVGPRGKTIRQGGYEYTWNPVTGRYE